MQLTRRVALNGQQLDAVDSRIVISSVEPQDGRENITAADTAAGFGQRITGRRRSTLDIIVKFRILEKGHSVAGETNRALVLEKVNAWAAAGGVLTTNYKAGRQLNVVLAQAPGEGSLWDYTHEYQITFRAYAVPYWEDSTESTQVIGTDDDSGSESFTVGGSAEAQIDAEIENTSGTTLTSVTLNVSGKFMYFTGLAVADGEKLVIDHVNGLIRIRTTSGTSYADAMAYRTAASVDDLTAAPGARACVYSADQDCTVTVKWRNRYL